MDVHARIQAFLQQKSIIPLNPAGDGSRCTKAGVVPFLRGNPAQFYVMEPVAKRPDLGPPGFQLCKGTRMRFTDGGWHDMPDGEPATPQAETLIVTALREGIEELGLRLEPIRQLFDLGMHNFASARSGQAKTMWLFAAEMAQADAFLPDTDIASTTAKRAWMTLESFALSCRSDHLAVLRTIEQALGEHYASH